MPVVHALHDDALANTSYVLELGDGQAVVVDPPRDVDDHLALAEQIGAVIVATLDTHVHADYVSGAPELAAHGVESIRPRDDAPQWPHRAIGDGERLEFGPVAIRAVATPGHTPEHLAYILEDDGNPIGVFTGGSLILGGAARTDLLGDDHTEELARAQFHSLRRLAELPAATSVYPTHGAGSFCLAAATTVSDPTIGTERLANPLLAIDDEGEFVDALTRGSGSYPTYYRHVQALNQAGPTPLAMLGEPPALTPAEAWERVERGAWLVDARPIHEWATAHPRGAISNELRPAFASWLGWVVPFGAPVVFVLDGDEPRAAATRLSRRIGYDELAFIDGGVDSWIAAGFPVAGVEEVDPREARRRQVSGVALLDVRQHAELEVLRVPGAEHLELGDIIAGACPDVHEVVVLCGHGERSATGASLLERRGYKVANLVGGTSAWADAGLPVDR